MLIFCFIYATSPPPNFTPIFAILSQQLSISSLSWVPVVGDHENGSAVPRFAFQPFRDQAHILPVKAAGGLIEYQYPAAGKDGASNGKPLLLPAGQGGRVRIPVLIKPKLFEQISGTVLVFFRQFGIQQQLLRHACRKKLR
ncbi:MAG: hypothetical protein BHV90_07195 [Clostridiales bacterium 42_27]|nr:MAG: hypothetical protein BHV90_07195 [Clostridiales bacterium 42_27]